MNKILKKARLFWATISKSTGYFSQFTNQIYKVYLNHNKVVHFRDGYPVYSLSTPALYSKPAANFFAHTIYRVIQNKNMPNLMSFAISSVCNANCRHCSFFGTDGKQKGKPLSLEQCKKVILEAQRLGVSVINLLGGEPLMKEEIVDIVKSVNKDLSTVIIFTNGWFLAEKATGLKRAGLDGVYVSIDSAEQEEHDKIRGKEGMFTRAMQGISEAKKAGLSVGISCCITKEDYNRGKLKKIIELGRKKGVHEILIFDAIPTGRMSGCKELMDDNDWIEEMIEFSEKYNLKDDYPGILVYAYATSYRSTGCSGGTSYFYISPFGDMSPCDFNHATFGNVLEEPMYKIWDRMSSLASFREAAWGGCKMKRSEFGGSEYLSTKGYKNK